MSNEKVFKHFPELPTEIRMMMIDEMEPEDRCRFTRCSYLSYKEARNSKKFIHRLDLVVTINGCYAFRIEVIYKDNGFQKQHGYRLYIKEVSDRKYIEYSSIKTGETLWKKEVKSSANREQCIVELFKKILNLHQNKIKHISIVDSTYDLRVKNYNFEVQNLNNLECLSLCGVSAIAFIKKLRRPLKELYYWEEPNNTSLLYIEQLSKVQEKLCIKRMNNLNNEQFLRLTAREMEVPIGELTELDISNFIESWKNGTLRDSFNSCRWDLNGWDFDERKLYQLLLVEYNGTDLETIRIEHNKEARRMSELFYLHRPPYFRFLEFKEGMSPLFEYD